MSLRPDEPVSIEKHKLEEVEAELQVLARIPLGKDGGTKLAKLEQAVFRLSVQPVQSLIQRHAEVSADVAYGRLTLQTEPTRMEVDSDNADLISMALVHGIRNALEHSPDRIGPLQVSAKVEWERGAARFFLRDNGPGPDWKRIQKRAKDLGWSVPERIEGESARKELLDLIFRPGFTTRVNVTQTSGRGMGLDAIRSFAKELGGDAYAQVPQAGGFELVLEFHPTRVGLPVERAGEQVWKFSDAASEFRVFQRLSPALAGALPEKLKKHLSTQSQVFACRGADAKGQIQFELLEG